MPSTPRDQCHGHRRQQQVDQRVLEVRQHTPPGGWPWSCTQFIGSVLREPARGFLRAQAVLDIHMKGRRHRVGIHDRRVADFTEAASRRRRHASSPRMAGDLLVLLRREHEHVHAMEHGDHRGHLLAH